MDKQQLIKKNQGGGYQDIYPKTFIDAIRDKESGMSLSDILNGFNMYFLPYVGSPESTRLLVPKLLRRQGLWITYVKYDKTVVTEWYAGEDISDKAWKNSSNWRIGNNNLVGDITISSDGNWVVNGENTGVKAQGEPGITPLLQIQDNKLQVSYTKGTTWNTISDYIAAWFRISATSATTAGDKICYLQISRDEGKTWSNLGEPFTNSLHIKGYVSSTGSLPSNAINGDIYGVGPTYDTSDSEHTNPIYNLYVKTSSGWVDNGKFTSIAAGVVQDLGESETEVVSQKAITNRFKSLECPINSNKVLLSLTPIILYSKAYDSTTGILTTFDELDCTELIEVQDYKNLLCVEINKLWYELACFNKNKEFIGYISSSSSKVLLKDTKYFSVSFLKETNIDYFTLKISLYSTESSIKGTYSYSIGFSPNIIKDVAYDSKTGELSDFPLLDCTEFIEVPNGVSFVNLNEGPLYEIACFDKNFTFLGASGNQRADLRIGSLLKNTKYFSISFLKENNIDYTTLKLSYNDFTYRLFSSIGVTPGVMKTYAYNIENGYLQKFDLLDCTPLIEIPDDMKNRELTFSCNKEYYKITCLDDEYNITGAVTSPANSIPLGSKYFSVSFLKEKSIDYNSLMISLKSPSETTNGLIIPVGKAGKKYYLFGDSITYWDSRESWYNPEVYMVAYPSYIRDVLGAEIINKGVAGDTSNAITTRLLSTDLSDAYAVTYMAGSNDIQQNVPVGELGTLDTSTYIGNLEKGLQYVLQNYPQVKFYFISPPYFKDHDITPYCEAMQKVAEAYAIPIIRWDLIGGINKINTDYYTVEGLHPNNLGHKLFADKLIPFLQMY